MFIYDIKLYHYTVLIKYNNSEQVHFYRDRVPFRSQSSNFIGWFPLYKYKYPLVFFISRSKIKVAVARNTKRLEFHFDGFLRHRLWQMVNECWSKGEVGLFIHQDLKHREIDTTHVPSECLFVVLKDICISIFCLRMPPQTPR